MCSLFQLVAQLNLWSTVLRYKDHFIFHFPLYWVNCSSIPHKVKSNSQNQWIWFHVEKVFLLLWLKGHKMRSSWIIRVCLKCSDNCPYKMHEEEEETQEERDGPVKQKQKLKLCSHKPRNTWSHLKLEEAKKDSFLEPWEGVWPYWNLDFWLLASRIVRECISVVLRHQICGNL